MHKKAIKALSVLLICIFTLSVAYIPSAGAVTKAKYKYEVVSKTKTYSTGMTAKNYYKKVVLSGNSKAIKKINKAISKDCKKFLSSGSSKSIHEYARLAPSDFTDTYSYKATSKVTYNKKGIISIRVNTFWFAGGVVNTDYYGLNYSLKTGKKISLSKVRTMSGRKFRKALKNKIIKSDQNLNISDINARIKNPDFYLKSGKIVVCFGPYELGYGGWARRFNMPGKYK